MVLALHAPREAVAAPLEAFYSDRDRYSLAFQVHVLATRAQQLLGARDQRDAGDVLVLERDPFDCELFLEAQLRSGEMDAFQHSAFTELADTMRRCFDLERAGRVYLRLDPDACMRRVRERGRGAERGLDAGRLLSLHRLHEAKYSGAATDARSLAVDARLPPSEIARLVIDHVRSLSRDRAQ